MAAIVLQRASHDVLVLERFPAESFKDQGAGIGLRLEVAEFLAAVGIDEKTMRIQDGAPNFKVIDADGSSLAEFPLPARTRGMTWRELTRALKEGLLSDARASGRREDDLYRFGSTVTAIKQTPDGRLSMTYQTSGSNEGSEPESHTIPDVDLVIGADGANSTVRTLMYQHLKQPEPVHEPAGYICYRGVLPRSSASVELQDLYEHTAVTQAGPSFSTMSYRVPGRDTTKDDADICFICYHRLSDDKLEIMMTDKTGRRRRNVVTPADMSDEAEGFLRADICSYSAPPIRALAEGADEVMVHAISSISVPQRAFLGGKVLLIGDAGGAARPHVFAGTSKGAFDALKLRDLVEGVIDVEKWEKDVTEYGTAVIDAATEIGDTLLGTGDENGLARFEKQNVVMARMAAVCGKLRQEMQR